jgi:hypothetical protein
MKSFTLESDVSDKETGTVWTKFVNDVKGMFRLTMDNSQTTVFPCFEKLLIKKNNLTSYSDTKRAVAVNSSRPFTIGQSVNHDLSLIFLDHHHS